jgi:hypothetical protein
MVQKYITTCVLDAGGEYHRVAKQMITDTGNAEKDYSGLLLNVVNSRKPTGDYIVRKGYTYFWLGSAIGNIANSSLVRIEADVIECDARTSYINSGYSIRCVKDTTISEKDFDKWSTEYLKKKFPK